PRARRYTLRLNRDGELVVTIPRGGSQRVALGFIDRSRPWIERQRARRAGATGHASVWSAGMVLLFRGERTELKTARVHGRPVVRFADQCLWIADENGNLRRAVEQRLRVLARAELPARTWALAREHHVSIHSVAVRDQSS